MENLNITIAGRTVPERELVSNVVTRALVNEGFSNVALINTLGEPMVGSNVPSLMDVMKRDYPALLDAPVRISSVHATVATIGHVESLNEIVAEHDTIAKVAPDAIVPGIQTPAAAPAKAPKAAKKTSALDNIVAGADINSGIDDDKTETVIIKTHGNDNVKVHIDSSAADEVSVA